MQEIFNSHLILEKYPGKGGWIYAIVENVPKQPKTAKGNWLTLSGNIDGLALPILKLWPQGGGKMFLPINAEIRKKIGKNEGDSVHIILYGVQEIPIANLADFEETLQYEPLAQKYYSTLSEIEKKQVYDFIFSKSDIQFQIDQMATALKLLLKNILPK
jgi:bifunctional DNA-binding transcriptional regulator/antitoxin component of YhaV-PrlF toxin-antitoxin module